MLIYISVLPFMWGCDNHPKYNSIAQLPEPRAQDSYFKNVPPPPPPPLSKDETDPKKIAAEKERVVEERKNGLGICYSILALDKYKNNDLPSAKAYFDSAIMANPTDAETYFNRGLIEFRLNDNISACSDMRKADELGLKEAKEILKSFCNK